MANTFDIFDNPVASGARDIGTSFAIGSNSLMKMAGDLGRLVTGEENILSKQAKENIEYLQQKKSPELIAAEQEREKAVNAETDPFHQAWAYVRQSVSNPLLFGTTVAETAPSSIGPGALGAGARMAAGKLLARKGAEFATKVGIGTALGTGAAMQGADVGGDQMDELLRILGPMDEKTSLAIPQIADLVQNKGASLPEAKTAVALEIARKTALGAGAASLASQFIPGGQTIEKAIVGRTEKGAAPSIAGRVLGAVKGAAGEIGQEVTEEGSGQTLKNIFARPVEPERETFAGVGPVVGQAVVGAGALGAAHGAAGGVDISRRPEATPRPVQEGETTAGMSGEPPAPAATKMSVEETPRVSLERAEEMTPDQFEATVRVRQALLSGTEPKAEDVRIAGEVPPPRMVIDRDAMQNAIQEVQQALDDWKARNKNAPDNIKAIFDPELLHNGYGIQGFYNRDDGGVTINAAFVTPENVGKIASHEWAHSTLATPDGREAFLEFAKREIPQAELDELAARYGTDDRLKLVEEWIAQNQEKAPGVIARIVAKVREWLSGLGIVDLTDGEVADIMLRTLREQAAQKVEPSTEGPRPDLGAEVYDTFATERAQPDARYSLTKLPMVSDLANEDGTLKYTLNRPQLQVTHYSKVPDLTVIDPKYMGRAHARDNVNHRLLNGEFKSFFFVGNSKPKAGENVSVDRPFQYKAVIDGTRLYDMSKDPLGLWYAVNPAKSEALLKDAGYDGFYAKTAKSDGSREFVALFHPTNVETGEILRGGPEIAEKPVSEKRARKSAADLEWEAWEKRRAEGGPLFSLAKEKAGESERDVSGILASPSITDIDYERARKNLSSADQARFKSQIADYAPEAKLYDAVGDWKDGAENSVAAIYDGPKSPEELQRIAAKAGLAGDQKAILWWTADRNGADAIHQIFWPKDVSMDEARQAMKDVGLDYRTLIQTPEGIRGLVFDQGRQNLNKIEALHEHPTEPSLDSHNATGDFLGSWTSRAEGRRAYRRVLGSPAETEAGARGGEAEQRAGVQPLTVEQADQGLNDGTLQYSLTKLKSPEFKGFFGDWEGNPEGSSKVTDENGKPMLMFHGTAAGEDFSIFITKADQAGAHFASVPAVASSFGRKEGGRVIPVYLDIRNPWRSRDLYQWDVTSFIREWADQHGQFPSQFETEFNRVMEQEDAFSENSTKQIQTFLKSKGYDGIVYLNRYEVYAPGEDKIPDERYGRMSGVREGTTDEEFRAAVPEASDAWIAFDPEQIKSAIGNVGAYGQRPVTAEEAARAGRGEMAANFLQRRGDISYSLTEKPVGQTALEDSESIKFKNQRETAKYLGDLLKKEFPEGLDRMDSETADKLANLLDRELSLALTMPENADAIGWYGREMEKVVEILRSPELNYQLDDPVNRGLFNAILAITSNGQEVVDQFLKSAQLYEGWRKTGKIPSIGKWGGERNTAMKGQLKFLNQMMNLVGPEATVGFLTSENSLRDHLDNLYGMVAEAQGLPEKATVADKNEAIGKYLNAGMPSGELKDYNTVGAIVFGPKLGGGFFANLYGKFDRLTMDRWFMRTFHRLTGRLGRVEDTAIQSALDEARNDLGAAEYLSRAAAGVRQGAYEPVSKERLSDAELLDYIKTEGKKAFKDYKEIKEGLKENPEDASLLLRDTLRRTYNRITKAESGLFDAPDNGGHRVFIRDVIDRLQKTRDQRGEDHIDTSDIQAILWYLEKDIWNRLKDQKAKVEEDTDVQDDEDKDDSAGRVSYSNGALELYRRKTGKDYVFKNGDQQQRSRVLAKE